MSLAGEDGCSRAVQRRHVDSTYDRNQTFEMIAAAWSHWVYSDDEIALCFPSEMMTRVLKWFQH